MGLLFGTRVVTGRTFWLDGAQRETPRHDNAEALVDRLVREGVVVRDEREGLRHELGIHHPAAAAVPLDLAAR
ncbi:hypothetical protein AB0M34_19830 [Nocardia sp. NPDC050193]